MENSLVVSNSLEIAGNETVHPLTPHPSSQQYNGQV